MYFCILTCQKHPNIQLKSRKIQEQLTTRQNSLRFGLNLRPHFCQIFCALYNEKCALYIDFFLRCALSVDCTTFDEIYTSRIVRSTFFSKNVPSKIFSLKCALKRRPSNPLYYVFCGVQNFAQPKCASFWAFISWSKCLLEKMIFKYFLCPLRNEK